MFESKLWVLERSMESKHNAGKEKIITLKIFSWNAFLDTVERVVLFMIKLVLSDTKKSLLNRNYNMVNATVMRTF